MTANGWRVAAVGDFGVLHCQPAQKFDRSTALDLTTSAPIVANGCACSTGGGQVHNSPKIVNNFSFSASVIKNLSFSFTTYKDAKTYNLRKLLKFDRNKAQSIAIALPKSDQRAGSSLHFLLGHKTRPIASI
jgi:hypothetical protein